MATRIRESDEASARGEGPGVPPDKTVGNGLPRKLLEGIPWSDRAEEDQTLCIAANRAGAFRVRNANGRTRILGEDRSDLEVTAHKAARAESLEAAAELLREIRLVSKETPDGLELDVEAPRKSSRHGSANLVIRLPRRMQVAVDAANGRIDVEGIRGPVRARSSNGCALIADIVGDVEVVTTNAKVCCTGIRGRLTARSSNGKIEIEQHRGAVDASTSNGLIRAALLDLGPAGIQLATSNGGIELALPEGVDADVDIRVDNGTIRNERVLGQITRETPTRVVGRLGHGGAPIKLRTSNGSILVR
ncbi:MAG: hypothetical protein OEW02_04330 [Myxococcales bacterium]|nr:hypothetical protein [Myxococcales bacterium]MDH5566341.1 hypothetical protein [Myxococcales bacterium]